MVKLLAPGGNLETARAVLEEGADAVYVGAKGWSRRTKGYELDDWEVRDLCEFSRSKGKRVRVAFNTLPSSFEVPILLDKVARYVEWGVRGVIMTDPGCMRLVRKRFPDIDIHVSAGSNAINYKDMEIFQEIGASVVVCPCRLEPEDMAEIKQRVDVELEVFLHANRCFTYLGKCMMSPYFKARSWVDEDGKNHFLGSPNRGGYCHRICKGYWTLSLNGKIHPEKVTLRNDAFLELQNLPTYIDIGINYLKLQGREYSKDLVMDIVRFYRKVIDNLLMGDRNIEKYYPELSELIKRRDLQRDQRTEKVLAQAEQSTTDVYLGGKAII